jgi:tellurite resistance protein TerC
MITTYPVVRKVGVAVVGFSVLAVGVALIVLPGPAILVIPLGLAILAKEFPWAQRLLDRAKALGRRLVGGRRLRSLVGR